MVRKGDGECFVNDDAVDKVRMGDTYSPSSMVKSSFCLMRCSMEPHLTTESHSFLKAVTVESLGVQLCAGVAFAQSSLFGSMKKRKVSMKKVEEGRILQNVRRWSASLEKVFLHLGVKVRPTHVNREVAMSGVG